MNRQQLLTKMKKVINTQCHKNNYVSFTEVLLGMGKLANEDYESWCTGKVYYLERLVKGNLGQLNYLLKEYHKHCLQLGWNPSITIYKKWGKGHKPTLRFSKSGLDHIEKAYSTHYVKKE
ncbi:hypothetical protein ACWE42_04120 [Sutcliffiella cohnii]|uniref:Uncharacterized protein n=1 Tax=Sutcliffiella cohnii TaxID=33932 RepID=A0A223KN77_9BACI|nr:hypothetical protein [Sutcliffiella cohnii]AST90847.1 hypothetical protein BC6307_05880 [Sutcliffiella cohnii]MED4017865.1 hypothetical protein [Sutcliffiella cohnii]